MNGWEIFLIVIICILFVGSAIWCFYPHYRARSLGLPTPSLFPSSLQRAPVHNQNGPPTLLGRIKTQIGTQFSSGKQGNLPGADGYRAQPSSGILGANNSASRGRFNQLDPDEAWDSRVGQEADDPYNEHDDYDNVRHEEQVGLNGVGGTMVGERGRSISRQKELDQRYDEEMGRDTRGNPFGDTAERSDLDLRGMSPRPLDRH